MTAQQQARIVAPWVMAEVLATDDRQSLEGLGLISVSLYRDPAWQAPAAAARSGPERGRGLGVPPGAGPVRCASRARSRCPRRCRPNHEIFVPRLGPIRVRLSGSGADPQGAVLVAGQGHQPSRRLRPTGCSPRLGASADPTTAARPGSGTVLTAPHTPVDWLQSTHRAGPGRRPPGRPRAAAAVLGDRRRPGLPVHRLPADRAGLRPRRLPGAGLRGTARAVRPASRRHGPRPLPGRLPSHERRPADGDGAHRAVGEHGGRGDPAAVHPRRDQRPVLLDHLRARRRRRRAAGGACCATCRRARPTTSSAQAAPAVAPAPPRSSSPTRCADPTT